MAPSIDTDTRPIDATVSSHSAKVASASSKSESAFATKLAAASAFPKDQPRFMTSTWHKDATLFSLLKSNPLKALLLDLMYLGPVPKLEGKLGVVSSLEQHMWIFPRTLPPMIAQYISMKYYDFNWPLPLAFGIYAVYFIIFAKMLSARLKFLTAKFGYLDAKVARDHPPDVRANLIATGILATITLRPLLGVFMVYSQTELPHLALAFKPWSIGSIFEWAPLRMFIYVVVLDFYFYFYHRIMHEVDFLWKFHKTHHMTKHPTYILSGFADVEQDVFDIIVIPMLATFTWKIDFFTWWVVTLYIFHTEAMGHSGLRAYVPTPFSSPMLEPFGMELEIEDHDLHHRQGWKNSFNYGKQTRVWDVLFGTARPRVEVTPENIAW